MLRARKAVIFSIDALLAIIAAMSLITACFFYLSQIQTLQWTQPQMHIMLLDSLTTMRDTNNLRDLITSSDTATIQKFLDNVIPGNICESLLIYDRSNTLLYELNKTDCVNSPDDLYVSRRSFIARGQVYQAQLNGWFR